MATLTSTFIKDAGALFLETTATGIAPNIEFTYPIARVARGSLDIEYCHAVSSTSERLPVMTTVSDFYQSVPVTSNLTINDGVTVITGKIPSLGFAPVNVVCRLSLSSGAQVEPTTKEYITEHGSLLLDDSGANTIIQPAQVHFLAMRSQVALGVRGDGGHVNLKFENIQSNDVSIIQVNFGKYIVFSSFPEDIDYRPNLASECHVSRGNSAPELITVRFRGSQRNGVVLAIEFPSPLKVGDSVNIDCPDVEAYHAKEMMGKYTIHFLILNSSTSIQEGAYSFIPDDESATGESTDDASEISTSGVASAGFTLVGAVAIAFVLSIFSSSTVVIKTKSVRTMKLFGRTNLNED